jgi:hypothetical protein
MFSEGPTSTARSDAQVVEAFAQENGLTLDALVGMTIHGLAQQIRSTGTLTLPLQIGPSSPQCQACPFSRLSQAKAVGNIVRGPWS